MTAMTAVLGAHPAPCVDRAAAAVWQDGPKNLPSSPACSYHESAMHVWHQRVLLWLWMPPQWKYWGSGEPKKRQDKCKTAMGVTLRCCHRASLWSSELDISFVSTSGNLFQVLHPYFPVADTTLKSLHTLWETDILQLCSEGELSQPSPSNTCCSHHSSSLQDGGCFWLCLLSTSAVPDN